MEHTITEYVEDDNPDGLALRITAQHPDLQKRVKLTLSLKIE